MIYLLCFIICGLMGLWAHHYIRHFATKLIQSIVESYCEIFPENTPHFPLTSPSLKPIKCGQRWQSFLGAGGLCCINELIFNDLFLTTIVTALLIILITISIIDWHYQLISPALCQCLLCIGIGLAYLGYSALLLEQSLFSAILGFLIFWAIFYLSQWYYRKEMLGRGDYWLSGALSSFLYWQDLPFFIFLSCLSAISYALVARVKSIPFAPFLTLGAIMTFMLK